MSNVETPVRLELLEEALNKGFDPATAVSIVDSAIDDWFKSIAERLPEGQTVQEAFTQEDLRRHLLQSFEKSRSDLQQ